jgi:hypothetical protein
MKLTPEEVIDVIKKHKLTIERDPSLSQKVKNQQVIAIEGALCRVNVAEREHSGKKLRLFLFEDCNRDCIGCCYKDYNPDEFPVVESYVGYKMFLLTGGEPLLKPEIIKDTVTGIREQSDSPVYCYTAMIHKPFRFRWTLNMVDGMTVTLHEQSDVADFERLCKQLKPHHIKNKSMRLNVFEGIEIDNIPDCWQVKRDMVWIKNCPLPEGEVLMRLPKE